MYLGYIFKATYTVQRKLGSFFVFFLSRRILFVLCRFHRHALSPCGAVALDHPALVGALCVGEAGSVPRPAVPARKLAR